MSRWQRCRSSAYARPARRSRNSWRRTAEGARLAAFGLVEIRADAILRRADGVVRHALGIHTRTGRISLVDGVRRPVSLDRAQVLALVMVPRRLFLCHLLPQQCASRCI